MDAQIAMKDLQSAGIPAGVVMNEEDAFSDPHLDEIGFWETLEGAETGKNAYTSTLWKTALTDRSHKRAAPLLGEDNEYVYKELLGFDEDKYAEFESTGHIGMDYDI
jgi:crotonobetainyl-CoA:carnitine CoA-transferase CaiB-like acyl-CoA transferase